MENADPDPGGQKSPKISKKVLKTWKEKKFNNLDLYLKISIIKINNKTKFLNFKFIFFHILFIKKDRILQVYLLRLYFKIK